MKSDISRGGYLGQAVSKSVSALHGVRCLEEEYSSTTLGETHLKRRVLKSALHRHLPLWPNWAREGTERSAERGVQTVDGGADGGQR
jgi:hypothetical protein